MLFIYRCYFLCVLLMNTNTCPELKLLHAVEMAQPLESVRDITNRHFLIAYSAHYYGQRL